MSKKILEVYDLAEVKLGRLTNNNSTSAKNVIVEKKINSIYSLTFEIHKDNINLKYVANENLVRFDGEFYFIRNVVVDVGDSGTKYTVTCKHLSSSLEGFLNRDLSTDELKMIGVNAEAMLTEVLRGSGWTYVVSQELKTENKLSYLESKEESAFANLVTIAEKFSAFLEFDSTNKIVTLARNLPDRGIIINKGKNSKTTNVEYNTDDIVTKLYAFGGQNETTGQEVTIMNDNPTGMPYIENYSFFLNQGYTLDWITRNPIKTLHIQTWNASEYKDNKMLYDDAVKKLETLSKPKVKARVTAIDLNDYPEYFTKTPIIGEIVHVVDVDINLKLQARVTSIKKNYDNPLDLSIEIDNEIEYSSSLKQIIDGSKKASDAVSGLGKINGKFIDGVIDILNAKINSTQSKWYTDDNGNMIFESLDGKNCMKLGGGIFGISNEKNVDGTWNFRTFGDGNGFVADHIITGHLKGGLVDWNLEDGLLIMGESATDYLLKFDSVNKTLDIKMASGKTLQETLVEVNNTITSLFADNKVTPSEKIVLKRELDNLTAEKTNIIAQGTQYGVTTEKTAFSNAYTALFNYLNPLLADMNVTTTINNTTLNTDFIAYYNTKSTLLKKISDTAKTLADNAQTSATNANTLVSDIADDNKLTSVEKSSIKREWDAIVLEKPLILAQAVTYGVTTEKDSYSTMYTTLETYLSPLMASMTTTVDIIGATFRLNFTNYYNARTVLLQKLSDVVKGISDTAKATADQALTNTNTLVTSVSSAEQKITPEAIVSTVRTDQSYINDQGLKVNKASVISEINQTSESISINANKLNLTGYATFTSLSTSGQSTIDGGNIKTNTLSFTNLLNKPTIITDYSQLANKPYIPAGYSDAQAVSAWEATNYNTYITSDGVYTKNILASQIDAGTITGVNIKTSNTSNYVHLQDQWLDFNHNSDRTMSMGHMQVSMGGVPFSGYLPVIAFGSMPKTGDLTDLNSVSALATILYNSDVHELYMQNGYYGNLCGIKFGNDGKISFSGSIDFSNNSISGLTSDGSTIITASNIGSYVGSYTTQQNVIDLIKLWSIYNGGYNLYVTQTTSNIALYREGDSTPWLSLGSNGDLYVHGVKHA